MKIVANNSITVSNVNDGTITHTAWSYSADGTDRFTTVYPNLNLLTGTKNFSSIGTNQDTGFSLDEMLSDPVTQNKVVHVKTTGYANSGKYLSLISHNITSNTINIGTVITLSMKAKGTGNFKWGLENRNAQNITLTGDYVTYRYTTTLSSYTGAFIFYSANTVGGEFWTKDWKIEIGNTATPYMQSASEVTTADYPKYRGEYSDLLTTQSANPSDYKWELNIDALSVSSAFAYSADGADRFTTTYPNLNLLSNTIFKNYTPKTQQYFSMTINEGGVNNKPYVSASYTNPTANSWTDITSWTFAKEYLKPSTTYTFSFYLRGSGIITTHVYPSLIDASSSNGLADGKVITPAVDGYYNWNLTSEWVRHTYTFVTKSSITNGYNFLFRIYTGNSVDICLPKVEEGSTATPWMPSSTEVQPSDYPSYIGRALKYSTKPSDYNWEINSGYTDAKADAQQTQVTQLSQDLSGFKTTVANTYADKVSVASQITQSATAVTSDVQSWTNNKLTAYSTTQQTATSITNAVASKADKTQITQLSDSINLKVSKGDVVSQINVEAGQILFNSNKLVLNANTTEIAGDAFIRGDMIVDGSIKAEKLEVQNLSALSSSLGDITGGSYTSWSVDMGLDGNPILNGIYLYNGRLRSVSITNPVSTDPKKVGGIVKSSISGMEMFGGYTDYYYGEYKSINGTADDMIKGLNGMSFWSQLNDTGAYIGRIVGFQLPDKDPYLLISAPRLLVNGDIHAGGGVTTGSKWIQLSSLASYKVEFGRVTIRVNVTTGNSTATINVGNIPTNERPSTDLMFNVPAWSIDKNLDRRCQVNKGDGAVSILRPAANTMYQFEVSYALT